MTALLLAVGLLASAPQAASLVGLWDSSSTSRGGIGQTLEFRADGTFVDAVTVIVNGYYRVVGDRLLVGEQPPGADAGVGEAPRIKIDGDVLIQTGPDGSSVTKKRVALGETGKSGIVGAWRYQHYTDTLAFERYTSDGKMLFRLPMSASVGRFVITGNELVLERPSQPAVRASLEVRGDTLRLSSGGRTTEYRRDPAGPWYERAGIATSSHE